MARQKNRRKIRWLEAQSRRYTRIISIRHQLAKKQRSSLLFILTHPASTDKHYF
ncbi:YciY family protein [Tatumella terrea]|uniref:Uncharacterized protein YciY n=2 Tax=Erwiniaceae TaxID=1903409 RepID=A0ABW1VY03_9GAMM